VIKAALKSSRFAVLVHRAAQFGQKCVIIYPYDNNIIIIMLNTEYYFTLHKMKMLHYIIVDILPVPKSISEVLTTFK